MGNVTSRVRARRWRRLAGADPNPDPDRAVIRPNPRNHWAVAYGSERWIGTISGVGAREGTRGYAESECWCGIEQG